jgi:hypothetical protein
MTRRSSQEWQSIIEQQQASGLSVADFCKQQQFDFQYFQTRNGLAHALANGADNAHYQGRHVANLEYRDVAASGWWLSSNLNYCP